MTGNEPNESPREAHDRIVAEAVEEALAELRHLLTPAELADARRFLGDVIATHPTTEPLVKQLVPAPVLARSDKVTTDGEEGAVDGEAEENTG